MPQEKIAPARREIARVRAQSAAKHVYDMLRDAKRARQDLVVIVGADKAIAQLDKINEQLQSLFNQLSGVATNGDDKWFFDSETSNRIIKDHGCGA